MGNNKSASLKGVTPGSGIPYSSVILPETGKTEAFPVFSYAEVVKGNKKHKDKT